MVMLDYTARLSQEAIVERIAHALAACDGHPHLDTNSALWAEYLQAARRFNAALTACGLRATR